MVMLSSRGSSLLLGPYLEAIERMKRNERAKAILESTKELSDSERLEIATKYFKDHEGRVITPSKE